MDFGDNHFGNNRYILTHLKWQECDSPRPFGTVLVTCINIRTIKILNRLKKNKNIKMDNVVSTCNETEVYENDKRVRMS